MDIQDKLQIIKVLTDTIQRIYNIMPNTADIAVRQLNILIQSIDVDYDTNKETILLDGKLQEVTKENLDTLEVTHLTEGDLLEAQLRKEGLPIYHDKHPSPPTDVHVTVKPSDVLEALLSRKHD